MTNCWFCGAEMRWSSDFNYDEVNGEGEGGVVAMLACPSCNAEAEFSLRTDKEE